MLLRESFDFDCQCEVCQNDWPLFADLPRIGCDTGISPIAAIKVLRDGDITAAKHLIANIKKKAEVLERHIPCYEFAQVQQVMDQCFSLLGNRRYLLN